MIPILSRSALLSIRRLPAFRTYSTDPSKKNPKDNGFFAAKNIGIEVTPLIAFVSIAAGSAITFLVHHAYKDEDLRLKPGQIEEDDEELKKALASKG